VSVYKRLGCCSVLCVSCVGVMTGSRCGGGVADLMLAEVMAVNVWREDWPIVTKEGKRYFTSSDMLFKLCYLSKNLIIGS
jgi:hypothetical protein